MNDDADGEAGWMEGVEGFDASENGWTTVIMTSIGRFVQRGPDKPMRELRSWAALYVACPHLVGGESIPDAASRFGVEETTVASLVDEFRRFSWGPCKAAEKFLKPFEGLRRPVVVDGRRVTKLGQVSFAGFQDFDFEVEFDWLLDWFWVVFVVGSKRTRITACPRIDGLPFEFSKCVKLHGAAELRKWLVDRANG